MVAGWWVDAFADRDPTRLVVLDPDGDDEPHQLGRGNHSLRSLAFSPDGRMLATSWNDGRLRIWDVGPGS